MAAFSIAEDLAHFDVIVWNNVTGDVLTAQQREAMRHWLEQGGGFLALHAGGDNSHEVWPWYLDTVIRARFIGHPLDPQFQQATLHIEQPADPIVAALEEDWVRTDEWYSFEKSPRAADVRVLATIDESTYSPGSFFGKALAMGSDHPMIWKHCAGAGPGVLFGAGAYRGELCRTRSTGKCSCARLPGLVAWIRLPRRRRIRSSAKPTEHEENNMMNRREMLLAAASAMGGAMLGSATLRVLAGEVPAASGLARAVRREHRRNWSACSRR